MSKNSKNFSLSIIKYLRKLGEFMNIQSITQKFLRNNTITRSTQKGLNTNNASYPNLKPLNRDTVSFGAKAKLIPEPTVTVIGDVVLKNYENKFGFLHVLSTRLLDSMDAIARELKDTGLIFDRAYNEKAPIKSTNSYMSKLIRSGAAPRDLARATWYLDNLHDLSIFVDKILPALKSRGYEIATMQGRKKLPDFDVRLSGVSEKSKNLLPKQLSDVASFKEQKSGYGDIQFRLIDTLADKKKKTPLEIIILPGKHTAQAKSDESYFVYDITRVLKNEFHISEINDPEIHTPASRIQNNIGIIVNQLNDKISKPLFSNAKMLDIEHDSSQLLAVGLDADTSKLLPGLVEGIHTKTLAHYKAKINEIKANETLSAQETNEQIKLLKQRRDKDLQSITFVKERLAETIAKYGAKS